MGIVFKKKGKFSKALGGQKMNDGGGGSDEDNGDWTIVEHVTGGVKIKNFENPKLKYYERITNAYQSLAEFSIDPDPPSESQLTAAANKQAAPPPDPRSKQQLKV